MSTQAMSSVVCPQCRQPFTAPIQQIFDVGRDPNARNRLLSGQFNVARCPFCGYQGAVSSPVVYHDPHKELLLVYVPVELGLRGGQERLVGDLTNRVINALPPNQRKAYLLQPKQMLTLQSLYDRVLEAEGITPEMMAEQRARIELLQRLMSADDRTLERLAPENDARLDALFFQLLQLSAETAAAEGQRAAAEQLIRLREKLIPLTSFGRRAQEQQAAIADLRQAAGNALTPDLLLDKILHARSDAALEALVAVGRPVIDYAFFMKLTERISQAEAVRQAEEAARLKGLREKILDVVEAVDRQSQAMAQQAARLLEEIIRSENMADTIQAHLSEIDETFLMVLAANLEAAERNGQIDLAARLRRVNEQILATAQQAAPPELQLVNQLLSAESEAEATRLLDEHRSGLTPRVLELMQVLAEDLRASGQEDMAAKLDGMRRQAEAMRER